MKDYVHERLWKTLFMKDNAWLGHSIEADVPNKNMRNERKRDMKVT